jgi:hypothetical protein
MNVLKFKNKYKHGLKESANLGTEFKKSGIVQDFFCQNESKLKKAPFFYRQAFPSLK